MFRIAIDVRHCKGCGLCVAFCPKGALSMSRSISERGVNAAEVVAGDKCVGCLNCAVMCPDAAVAVFDLETSEA